MLKEGEILDVGDGFTALALPESWRFTHVDNPLQAAEINRPRPDGTTFAIHYDAKVEYGGVIDARVENSLVEAILFVFDSLKPRSMEQEHQALMTSRRLSGIGGTVINLPT